MSKKYTTFDKLPIGAIFTTFGEHPFSNYVYQKIKYPLRETPLVYCLSTKRLLRFNTPKLKSTYVEQL